MTPFVEYVEVGFADPLRQGDVLESVNPMANKWERNLFVLTADCDFAHDKHLGRVTCIPFLTKDEYLLETQAPRMRDRQVERPLADLQVILAKVGRPNVTPKRLREWASEQDVDDIIGALGVTGQDREVAMSALNMVRLIDSEVSSMTQFANALVDAQVIYSGGPKRENAVKTVTSRLRQSFTHTPGDALFISSLAAAHNDGYFAYLRHLEQVWQPNISIGPDNKQAAYRRISRLQDRFTHALVQRFGMVFMPIGLPNEYEEMRSLHADLMEVDVF